MTAVLMIEDHTMFREGLMMTIGHMAPSLDICPAASGAEALAVLESRADISRVIMDYYLPDIGGTALLKRLRQVRPGVRILVLSASEDAHDRRCAMTAGARAFLHKSASSQMLLSALEQIDLPYLPDGQPDAQRVLGSPGVLRGVSRGVSPGVLPGVTPAVQPGMSPPSPPVERPDEAALLSELTPRQIEVLRLMCDGIRNRDISEQLGVTEKTVKAHISVILATLGVPNRTQATLVARRGGLLGKPV
ncbi:response regulator [Achromobacter sp. PAB15]|uniref:response regulator n=1 Tax=Achromobacter sp. PAB15 TaxID=3233048 RepID=UPI003F91A5A8